MKTSPRSKMKVLTPDEVDRNDAPFSGHIRYLVDKINTKLMNAARTGEGNSKSGIAIDFWDLSTDHLTKETINPQSIDLAMAEFTKAGWSVTPDGWCATAREAFDIRANGVYPCLKFLFKRKEDKPDE